ncbi:MAG: hypothetical protein JWM08_383 [Candidatus Angelobacter sp.]|nr:hypothetical protein [Candidatus Angelobacter sp.]
MPCGIVDGKQLMDKENQEYKQQQTTPPSEDPARRAPRGLEQQDQVNQYPNTREPRVSGTPEQRAEALALKLAQTYEELTRLLERNPGVKRQITEGAAKEEKVYQKLKQRLKLADMAPRCRWVRQDGTSCRSPQMKQHIYCFAHMQMAEARTLLLMLPAAEDANAIQVGLMRIQKALIEDTISTKKAGLLLYSMQLALTNVGQTTFGQAKDEEMVRDTVDEEEAFSENRKPLTTKDTEDTEEEKGLPRNQNLFATEGTEDTEKSQGLPLMNTDDTDFGEGGEDGGGKVEFVPVPGGYGFERVRLRIEPELGRQRRPVQPVITPKDSAQVHNSSLRDERLPKGPRFASESLDADTVVGSVLQTEPYANLG